MCVTERKILKWMRRIFRENKIRNLNTGLAPIVDEMRENRFRRLKHILRKIVTKSVKVVKKRIYVKKKGEETNKTIGDIIKGNMRRCDCKWEGCERSSFVEIDV